MELCKVVKNVYGGKFWVAKITGEDEKFGFERQFLRKYDITSAKTNVYRDIEILVPLEEEVIYEYSAQTSSRQSERGFWIVQNGSLVPIEKDKVLEKIIPHTIVEARHG